MRTRAQYIVWSMLVFKIAVATAVASETEYQPPIAESPTENPELYEEVRADRIRQSILPDASFNFLFSPHAFSEADLRVNNPEANPTALNPSLYGISLGIEALRMKPIGGFGAGVDFSLYGNAPKDRFSALFPAVMSAAPYVQYFAGFLPTQIVVPTARAGVEYAYYHFKHIDTTVHGSRLLLRAELGLMIFLNPLEPSSASYMHGNYDIKRTYLVAYFTNVLDPQMSTIDLAYRGMRLGFRFEY